MSIKSLAGKVTSKIGRQVLVAQKHSPAFLFAVGVVGIGASTVLACKATLKLDKIIDESKEKLDDIALDSKVEDKKKSSMNVKTRLAIDIAKLYMPAAAIGLASLAAVTGSHVILQRRNAAVTAAFVGVDRMFKDYRKRVVEEQGKGKDLEYLLGVEEKEIAEEGETGIEVKTVKSLKTSVLEQQGYSPYAVLFDETNQNWDPRPNQNQFFLRSRQNWANDLLSKHGKLYLNDVFDLLGFERTDAGQVVGWVSNPENNEGDGLIDFGMVDGTLFDVKAWITEYGHKDGIILDFNVDGIVLDFLKKR